ncbi:Haloacid dehalogenase-like hydrolase domain protein [mine drainage metagenome]|uniref:Haloacid dehalogenase-like hydrolase domain protein n=1 Tax=mine drainage metagenome TaxID=410659 RepID=T0ZZT6_9ZZZZ
MPDESPTRGDLAVEGLLFDLDDVLVPVHTVLQWQWAWRPNGPRLPPAHAQAVLKRALRAWDRRRWTGLTGRAPPVTPDDQRAHLASLLDGLAGRPLSRDESEAVVARFQHPSGPIESFPEVKPRLEGWIRAGLRVGIVTPWPLETARRILRRAELDDRWLLLTADEAPTAYLPAPTAYRHAVERLGTPRRKTVYVGDLFWSDVHAAARAGLRSILLDRRDLWPHVADDRIRSLDSLDEVLRRAPTAEARSAATGPESSDRADDLPR